MNYSNKEKSFIDESIKSIDQEIQQEYEIREQAEYLSKQLQSNKSVRVPYNDTMYSLALGVRADMYNQKHIILLVSDETKQKEAANNRITPKLYTPKMVKGEYNDEFTYEENINTVVSAWLADLQGKLIIEQLDED